MREAVRDSVGDRDSERDFDSDREGVMEMELLREALVE